MRQRPIIAGSAFLLGIPSSLGFGALAHIAPGGMSILDAVDFAASNVLLPISGMAIAVFAGWHWRRTDADAAMAFRWNGLARLWRATIRYLAPAVILVILLRSLSVL